MYIEFDTRSAFCSGRIRRLADMILLGTICFTKLLLHICRCGSWPVKARVILADSDTSCVITDMYRGYELLYTSRLPLQ